MRRGEKTIPIIVAVLAVLCLFGTVRADLTDGLVSHWKFDEGAGDTAYDSAGNNDGTIYGAQWAGKALNFDGINDYVNCGNDDSLNVTEITISAWINSNILSGSGTRNKTIVCKAEGSLPNSAAYDFVQGKWDYSKLAFAFHDGSWHTWSTNNPVMVSGWMHVAVTYDGSSDPAFYVNGVLEANNGGGTAAPLPANTAELIIGAQDTAALTSFFDGTIDDVRIYDRALSSGEIEQLYQSTLPVLAGLEIIGPDEVAEDCRMQYGAIAVYDNGITVDVTDSAYWSVEPNDYAGIEAGMLATEVIIVPHEVVISAEYSEGAVNKAAQKRVSIVAICPSGSALKFDGEDDYVDIPYDSSLDIDASGGITVTAWIKLSSYPAGGNDYRPIFSLFADGGTKNSLAINKLGDGSKISWSQFPPSGGDITSIKPDLDVWYYVAAVQDSNYRAIYINGNLDSSDNLPETYTGGTPDIIRIGGGAYNWAAYSFDGTIDDVAIFNRALSPEEIWAGMHTKLTGGEDGLMAYWDFDDGEGLVAGDSSSRGNDGAVIGAVWVDSDAPVGVCSLEEIVERNLTDVVDMKMDALDILGAAMAKEEAVLEMLNTSFKNRDFGTADKGDIAKAKQKIHSAIQEEEQAVTAVDGSIEKLDDAMRALESND